MADYERPEYEEVVRQVTESIMILSSKYDQLKVIKQVLERMKLTTTRRAINAIAEALGELSTEDESSSGLMERQESEIIAIHPIHR